MKKLLAVWALLLAAVSANAADKKCPGTVHFLDGRTLECTSITIPGWIDAEVSVRVLSDGKNLRAGMSPSLPVIRLTKCLIKGWSGL